MRRSLHLAVGLLLLVSSAAASAGEARITRVIKDVKILRPQTAARIAAVNEEVANGAAVQTGVGSQTELIFNNQVQARLAANTVLGIGSGSRRMGLAQGAILVRAPAGAGEAQIKTAFVTTVVKGTTSILEYYPEGYIKLIVLEGTARMFIPGVVGESVLVNAGQLLMFHAKPAPKALPNPVDIDLNRLMATSQLIKGFAPLGSEPSIAEGMQSQKKQKSQGALVDTNLVIFGRGTLVSLVPPDAQQAKNAPTPSPTPAQKSGSSRVRP